MASALLTEDRSYLLMESGDVVLLEFAGDVLQAAGSHQASLAASGGHTGRLSASGSHSAEVSG